MKNIVNCRRCFYCIKVGEQLTCRKLQMNLQPNDLYGKCILYVKRIKKKNLRS